jgi:hypothetical protein
MLALGPVFGIWSIRRLAMLVHPRPVPSAETASQLPS